MAIAGYNFYVNGVKHNTSLRSSPTYTYTGLASDGDYDLTATAVDFAGLESEPSPVLPAQTLEYVPPAEDPPMSTADRNTVDAIVAAAMGSNGAPGVAVAAAPCHRRWYRLLRGSILAEERSSRGH